MIFEPWGNTEKQGITGGELSTSVIELRKKKITKTKYLWLGKLIGFGTATFPITVKPPLFHLQQQCQVNDNLKMLIDYNILQLENHTSTGN